MGLLTYTAIPDKQREVYDRAQLLLERRQPNEVLQMLSPELNKDFADPYALELLGHAFYERGDWGIAANLYKQAHVIRPNADVLTNLGACFKNIDDMKSAQEAWELGLEMEPVPHKASGLMANIGGCYTANGTPDRAIHYYRKALEIDPTNRTAFYNMCWPLLEKREWAEGFKAYDSGFTCGTRTMRNYDRVPGIDVESTPEQMREAVNGKRVIVWGDQGLGDEIMAASCIPDLIQDAKEVVFDCHPRLTAIFSRSFGIECTGTRKSMNIEWFRNRQFDIAVPITTLMTIYRSKGEWPGTPYLKTFYGKSEQRPLKIGVSWAGGVASTRAHIRSMPLATLRSMLEAIEAHWFSLQYHESASAEVCRLDETSGVEIRHFPEALTAQDYDRTAELVSNLDLVITVCTSVMHLAGAMGIPCWVMTPNRAPWVMGIEGDTMPMYKSVRIFRQTAQEQDWSGVISRIGEELQTFTRKEAAE